MLTEEANNTVSTEDVTDLLTEASLHFSLGEKIGNGGAGDVYLAHDIQLDAQIAVKKVPFNKFSNMKQFFEESKKLYDSRHNHVAEVKYACKDKENVYLAMPYYQNGSIHGIMNKRALTSREIIRYSLHFLSGLNNIHTKGLIHFDIKPENMLLTKANQAVISDFGVAQYTNLYGFTVSSGTTPVFAPPEFFQQLEHSRLFDIYQAGLAMYRMCIGDDAFSHQVRSAHMRNSVPHLLHFVDAIKNGTFPDRSAFLPHIPKPLATVIKKALSVDPEQRYQSVIDMMNGLSKIDNANDWQYMLDARGIQVWTRGKYEVTAIPNGNLWQVKSVKNGRKNHNFCDTNLNLSKKNALLYKCLNTNW